MSNNANQLANDVAELKATPKPNKVQLQCDCSKLKILTYYAVIKAGDVGEFRIDSDDPEYLSRSFNWTTSAGTITSGQGSSRITVLTTQEMFETDSTADTSAVRVKTIGRPAKKRAPFTVTVATNDSCNCQPARLIAYVSDYELKINEPANVEELLLDKLKVTLPCPSGFLSSSGIVADEPVIKVDAIAKDPDDDVLAYNYSVSGGKIVGKGANVKWDLSNVMPGKYEIIAAVDDGCGACGKTKKKEITVAETPDCLGHFSCPDIKLIGPDQISGPGIYTVTANLSGASGDNEVLYLWTITNGTLLNGFGTPSVDVRIPSNINGADPVIALQVKGASDPRGLCPDKVTLALPVRPR